MERRNFSISWRHTLFGLIAAAGALLVAIALRLLAEESEEARVRILTAKVPVPAFSLIRREDLRWVDWPADSVPTGAYLSVKDLIGEDGRGDRYTLWAFKAGEPIVASKVAKIARRLSVPGEPGPSVGTTRRTDATRAVRVSIKAEVYGVSAFAAPGDLVDILLGRVIGGEPVISVVMSSVLVVAADSVPPTTSGENKRTFTLELMARDAQTLVLVQQMGRLSVSLRASEPREPRTGPDWFRIPPEPNDRIRGYIQTDFPIPPVTFPGWEPPSPSRTVAESASPDRP
jgi:pilus assembly protein CpaB